MAWLLLVDANEQAHYAKRGVDRREFLACNACALCEVRPMDVFDYALVWRSSADDSDVSASSSFTERLIVGMERATQADMASKIVDGRYKSQSQRMVDSGVPVLVWLIVDQPTPYKSEDVTRVRSALTHLGVAYPRTRVTRLENGDHRFAEEIRNLMRYSQDAIVEHNALADAPLYTVAQDRGAKVRMDTQQAVYRECLTIPHGMSHRSADAIIAHTQCRTVLAMMRFYARARRAYMTAAPAAPGKRAKAPAKRTLVDHLDNALADVPLGKRRLGPALSRAIRRTLLCDDELDKLEALADDEDAAVPASAAASSSSSSSSVRMVSTSTTSTITKRARSIVIDDEDVE